MNTTDPKPRRASLLRIIAILAVAVPLTICIVGYASAPGPTRYLVSKLFHSVIPPKPVQLLDVVENVVTSSWTAVPLQVPYSGVVTIDLSVISGNPVSIKLIHSSEIFNFKNKRPTNDYSDFSAQDTRTYRRSTKLGESDFFLIVQDNTLGLISSKASDIKIHASLSPE